MKKLIILILMIAVLAIAACGGNEPLVEAVAPVAPPPQQAEATPPAEPEQLPELPTEAQASATSDFSLDVGNFTISMSQNIDDTISALGEPLGVFEQPSCAFDGIDRIFSFPGLQIHTYPVGDADFIHTVSIRDDSHVTGNGIYLGVNFNAVVAAYGSEYEQEGSMFTFTRGITFLQFFIESDIVTAITYGLIFE